MYLKTMKKVMGANIRKYSGHCRRKTDMPLDLTDSCVLARLTSVCISVILSLLYSHYTTAVSDAKFSIILGLHTFQCGSFHLFYMPNNSS
jgi:hypothetical protein